jgi:hypothetical protein
MKRSRCKMEYAGIFVHPFLARLDLEKPFPTDASDCAGTGFGI